MSARDAPSWGQVESANSIPCEILHSFVLATVPSNDKRNISEDKEDDEEANIEERLLPKSLDVPPGNRCSPHLWVPCWKKGAKALDDERKYPNMQQTSTLQWFIIAWINPCESGDKQ